MDGDVPKPKEPKTDGEVPKMEEPPKIEEPPKMEEPPKVEEPPKKDEVSQPSEKRAVNMKRYFKKSKIAQNYRSERQEEMAEDREIMNTQAEI